MKNRRDLATIIICTRPESNRLPRKVFRKIAGISAIEHILKRISLSSYKIILAIPKKCDEYDYLKKKYNIEIYRGNPDSPLHRMADCIKELKIASRWIIRITHDDILIDVRTMDELVDKCELNLNCGYGISPKIVDGAGVEVVRKENIIKAAEKRKLPTEFISYFVKNEPFQENVIHEPRQSICRDYRLTMDYYSDVVVLETILRQVGPLSSLDRVVEYVDRHSYILRTNRQPKVSIYTCAYNAEKYLQRTMESILAHPQYSDFEYIFLDDGSIDSTLSIAMKFNHDPRIKYVINEENKGLSSSSNIALSHARGKYVMRVDADDLLLPQAIVGLVNNMEAESSSICYPAYMEIDENEMNMSEILDPAVYYHPGCALMDKRMINEIRFTDGLKHWDGLDLYERIKNKFPMSFIQEPLWYYRRYNGSLSSKLTPERKKARDEVLNNVKRD